MSQDVTAATPKKRKRASSSAPASSSINPLSHPPALLSQFSLAGLAEADIPPSSSIPDFPHRGFWRSLSPTVHATSDQNDVFVTDGEDQSADDIDPDSFGAPGSGDDNPTRRRGGGGREKSKAFKNRRKRRDEDEETGVANVLIQSVQHFLSQNRIKDAARAFGLVMKMKPHGTRVDIRKKYLWATGAEILMRQSEQPTASWPSMAEEELVLTDLDQVDEEVTHETSTPVTRQSPKRDLSQNMTRVREYYERLIQLYPWDYRQPRRISALDFWPALLECEIYVVNATHVLRVRRARSPQSPTPELESEDDDEAKDRMDRMTRARQTQQEDAARAEALRAMEEIRGRMDDLMTELPYSKSISLLKLRAVAALYISDLVVPVADDVSGLVGVQQAYRRRESEREIARDCLRKVLEIGGELNSLESNLLNGVDERHESADATSSRSS